MRSTLKAERKSRWRRIHTGGFFFFSFLVVWRTVENYSGDDVQSKEVVWRFTAVLPVYLSKLWKILYYEAFF